MRMSFKEQNSDVAEGPQDARSVHGVFNLGKSPRTHSGKQMA